MNVLVAGSSSGIGETVARALAAAGHRLVLMARRADRLTALAAELAETEPGGAGPAGAPVPALAVPGDVGNWADCVRAVEAGLQAFGRLDALVNAAGAWVAAPFVEAQPDDLQRFIRTDVLGAAQITLAVLPALQQAGGGRIVHVNGLQGFLRHQPPVLYAAVESAVRGLCESLRWEAAPYGVHVGLLTLGLVAHREPDTPEPAALYRDGRRDRLSRSEVAEAVLFMLQRPAGVNVDELVMTPLGQR